MRGLSWLKRPSPFWLFVLAAFCAATRGLSWLKCPSPNLVFAFAAFCAAPLPLQLPARMFGIVTPINLRPMTATGILPGDVMIALAFAAATVAVAVAFMFVGGG
jgi:hypothetical protein